MTGDVLVDKSKAFALQTIKLYGRLAEGGAGELAAELLRCGTGVGAKVRAAVHGDSKSDFYACMSDALRDAGETEYRLELLYEAGYIDLDVFGDIYADCRELIVLLTAITGPHKQDEE